MTTSVGQAVPRRNGHDERQHFLKEIQEWFSVEFLARIDELIVFVGIFSLFPYALAIENAHACPIFC